MTTEPLLIRQATIQDADAILQMADRAVADNAACAFRGDSPETRRRRLLAFLEHPAARGYLAVATDQPVGMIGALQYADPITEQAVVVVLVLWIAPAARAGWVGVKLVHAIEAWGASCGGARVQIPSWTERSDAFYQQLGYEPRERVWEKPSTRGREEDDAGSIQVA